MYQPTMNYREACQNPEEQKAFEAGAMEEAQKLLAVRLGADGFETVEDARRYLRGHNNLELMIHAGRLAEIASEDYDRAIDPDIDPDKSFKCLAECYLGQQMAEIIHDVVGATSEHLALAC